MFSDFLGLEGSIWWSDTESEQNTDWQSAEEQVSQPWHHWYLGLDTLIFRVEGCVMYCRMFHGISGLYAFNASSTPAPSSCDDKKKMPPDIAQSLVIRDTVPGNAFQDSGRSFGKPPSFSLLWAVSPYPDINWSYSLKVNLPPMRPAFSSIRFCLYFLPSDSKDPFAELFCQNQLEMTKTFWELPYWLGGTHDVSWKFHAPLWSFPIIYPVTALFFHSVWKLIKWEPN